MKISKIFHFLYFSVLSIPLISMPIFAIYSQNHEITGYEVTQEVEKQVYFNQQVQFDTTTPHYQYVNTYTIEWDNQTINGYSNIISISNVNRTDKFLTSYYFENSGTGNLYFYRYINGSEGFTQMTKSQLSQFISSYTSPFAIYVVNNGTPTFTGTLKLNIINLTYMFGEGNEPTIEQFNLWYPDIFYEYTYLENQYIDDYTITYNDTDIMSQFIYNEYNFMDKYLGIYKFSPFNNIYQWLQNTFFGGSSPMVFTIFYQWFAYWLFVSLCWLIFDVLMYVPLMIHRWLDKAEL